RSLTAKVKPSSGPAPVGSRVTSGPGANAPISVAAPRAMVEAVFISGALAERADDCGRVGDETKAFLHVPDRRLRAEIRRRCGAAILDQEAAIAQEVRIRQRVHYALIGVDAGEQNR